MNNIFDNYLSISEFSELIFMCKRAGLKNLAQVQEYCKANNITIRQLYIELDELFTPSFMKESTNEKF